MKEKSPEQVVDMLWVNNGKTHSQHAQLVGQKYHEGIALSPEFKGYRSNNKQTTAKVQQWPVQMMTKVQQRQSPTMAVESGVQIGRAHV